MINLIFFLKVKCIFYQKNVEENFQKKKFRPFASASGVERICLFNNFVKLMKEGVVR